MHGNTVGKGFFVCLLLIFWGEVLLEVGWYLVRVKLYAWKCDREGLVGGKVLRRGMVWSG